MLRSALLLASVCLVPTLGAQGVVVNYPDATITSPSGQYPVYTPKDGSTVRGQIFCPSSFAGLPKVASVCTHVGIQIAGNLPYTTFVGRAGKAGVTSLGTTFATNLPDQRVQFDLSGQNLPGGGSGTTAATQVNVWVEFPLCHPFVWKPGDSLIVDITAKSKVAGQYCRSATGSGVPRMMNTSYTPTTTTGTTSWSGGLKLRFVFEPLYAPIVFGAGCAGTNSAVPLLAAKGSTQLGKANLLTLALTNARPSATTFLVVGGNCLDLPIFGGCHIYPSIDLLIGSKTSTTGTANQVLIVPSSTTLDGAAITMQYAIDDPNTAAKPLTFSLSNGLRLLLLK